MLKTLYSFKSKYLYLFLIFVFSVAFSYNGNMAAGAVSAAIGGAFFAVLSFSDCNKKILYVLPLISAITVWLLTADEFKSLLSIGYLIVGLSISYSVSKLKNRSQSIMISAFALGIFYLIIYFAHIIYAYGYLTVDSIKAYVNLFFDKAAAFIKNSNDSFVLSDGKHMFSEESINSIIISLKYSFAGLYISGLLIASFFSNLAFKVSVSKLTTESEMIRNVSETKLTLSRQAGVVFIILYVIAVFATSLPPYMILTIETFTFPLQLGLVYMGASVMWQRLKNGRLSVFSLAIVAAASLFIFGSFLSVLISVMTIFGLFDVFRKNRKVNKTL